MESIDLTSFFSALQSPSLFSFFDLDESRQGFIGHARVYRLKHFTSGLLTQHHFCVSDLITEKSSGLLSGSNLRVRAIRQSVNTPKTRSRRHYRSIGRDTKRMNQQTERYRSAPGPSHHYKPNYLKAEREREALVW